MLAVFSHNALQMHFRLVLLCVNIVSYGTQTVLAEAARTRVEGAIRGATVPPLRQICLIAVITIDSVTARKPDNKSVRITESS